MQFHFILFGFNTPKLASFDRATESVAGVFNTSGLAPRIFISAPNRPAKNYFLNSTRIKNRPAAVYAGMLFLSFLACALQATQTNNHGIHAVPVPNGTPLPIDGSLSGWDLSGRIFSTYDIENLRDLYSVTTAAMYDAENLYIALHWKSPRPMSNSHDPRYAAARAWAGDCVQLRFKTDRITHITAWYYAPRNEPAITLSYGKSLTEPFDGGDAQLFAISGWKLQRGVEMAFKNDPDGKGYVQEIKIPWPLITSGKKYNPGDQFNLGIEYIWGSGDWPAHRYADNLAPGATSREFFWSTISVWGPIFLEPHGNLNLPDPVAAVIAEMHASTAQAVSAENTAVGPVELPYTLEKNSRVTLAIDDSQGRRIRNLIPSAPRRAGSNAEHWDGLDDDGKPVPPGKYVFKFLIHDGIHVRYALSFANPGNPSWATPDGRGAFYADHTAPQAAAASPDGDIVALACPTGESGNHLIACTLDGHRLWGINNRNAFDGGHISLATDGTTLWIASEGKQSTIYRFELATGRYSPWSPAPSPAPPAQSSISAPVPDAPPAFAPLDLRVSTKAGIADKSQNTANLTAIAISSKKFSHIPFTLAASFAREDTVRLYDPDTGALRSEIPIPAPQALTFTPDGHLIILSDNHLWKLETLNSPPTLFTPAAYSGAIALATDRDGYIYLSVRGDDQNIKIFAPDGTPRARTPEIGTRGGRPANGPYNANAILNPAGLAIDSHNQLWVTEENTNPKRTSIWNAATGKLIRDLAGTTYYASTGALNPYDTTMGFSDNTIYHLDWPANTFAPVYSLARRDASPANTTNPDLFPPSVQALTSRAVLLPGNVLAIYTPGNATDSSEIECTLYDGKNWRSAAHLGLVRKNNSEKYKHPFFNGHENQFYLWADENGDGLVQPNELHFANIQIEGSRATPRSFYWGQLPSPDGTITYMLQNNPRQFIQFPITSLTKANAPLYDIAHPRIITADRPIIGLNESHEGMLIGGSEGRVYINQDPLITIDSTGHISGGYPNHNISVHGSHYATAARPGYLIGPSSILGTAQIGDPAKNQAGEIFILNGNLGENYLFTQDALYIQTLFRDTRGVFEAPPIALPGMSMDNITAGGESFGGNLIHTPDGHTYLTIGSTDARVLEITGLESIRRQSGTFTYSKEQYDTAQKLLASKLAASQPAKTLVIPRAPADKSTTTATQPATLAIPETPQRVQISYDAENLNLAYQIKSPRKSPKNIGQDEHLLFKTGDSVDLMIAPADNTTAALRILMTTQRDGKPIAVLNQKKAPQAPPSEKYDFSSPWRTITFDRVVTITPQLMRLVITPQKDGYILEAAIPWRVLGITPAPGLRLRLDTGVLTGDTSSQTTSRRYWSNQATNLVNDIPGEADLTPNLWGTATLE